ncbi:MAG: hypothetical protein JO019_03350 [Candidatus Kaiserbacteria bacterium]|nr:hypothetical protein [Candidatus Kaiserbacteria bacterium]
MPLIDTGKSRFTLEEGQSYAGWTLKNIEHYHGNSIGTHLFTFVKDGCVRRITNLQWPGELARCSNGSFGVFECPAELAIFSYRTTKVLKFIAAERHDQWTDLY